jgi:hypothetical protein
LAHADLVEVAKEIPRVLVTRYAPRALELFPAVTTPEEADDERAGATRGQKIPYAVPDNDRVDMESIARSDQEVRIGFRVLDLISRDHRHMCRVDSD